MDTQDLVKIVSNKLQDILRHEHSDARKHNFYTYGNRINFACPFCGDSHSSALKRRGNIYTNSMSFVCFNCGKKMSVSKFMSSFDEHLSIEAVEEINRIYNEMSRNTSTQATSDLAVLNCLSDVAIEKDTVMRAWNAKPIENGTDIHKYIVKRMLDNMLHRFAYNDFTKQLLIFNLTNNGNVAGMQIRNMVDKHDGRKYMSYTISKLYEKCGLDIGINDAEMLGNINKLSLVFGILQVDLFKDITVFEGPIDSFFMKNSIAPCGVNRGVDFLKDFDNIRFVYDNDGPGKEMMIRELHKGKRVFLWEKYLDENNLSRGIKDMNELVQNAGRCNRKLKPISDYFSSDPLDVIYM